MFAVTGSLTFAPPPPGLMASLARSRPSLNLIDRLTDDAQDLKRCITSLEYQVARLRTEMAVMLLRADREPNPACRPQVAGRDSARADGSRSRSRIARSRGRSSRPCGLSQKVRDRRFSATRARSLPPPGQNRHLGGVRSTVARFRP